MEFRTYLENHDGDKEKSPLTIKGYVDDVAQFETWRVSTLTPAQLNRVEVREWLNTFASPATQGRKYHALKAFVRYGLHTGQLHSDPLERLKLLEQPQQLAPRSLAHKDKNKLLGMVNTLASGNTTKHQHYAHTRTKAIVYILTYSGLRVSELCALRLSDICIEKPAYLTVTNGKGGTHGRVPVTTEMIVALEEWLAIRAEDGDSVFNVTPRTVQRDLAELRRACGLAHLTPHTLRHTCGNELTTNKYPLPYIKGVLRHKDIRSSARYAELNFEQLAAAAESVA